jgi:hypothetical protein
MGHLTNPELELAFDFVRNTDRSLFLTGKAGSGKTTFLHAIKAEGLKQLVVVAPTGVAAINAGGMTIHSFFQLPFGLHIPGANRTQQSHSHRLARQKKRLIRSLDLLVIDEISMVRADMLDAIDQVLRMYRETSVPFGGVQLLMIGDLHQLPPVVKPEDWALLKEYYSTPYFFSSQALQQIEYVSIELKHIYRQSDPTFIDLLNRVRDNKLDEVILNQLNSRYVADFQPPAKEPYITLTATNAVAGQINVDSLARLRGSSRVFEATIQGDFPPSAYPTEERFECKVGAQVMFVKNDLDAGKRFFNGKLGQITGFDEDIIYVRCPGDSSDIAVERLDWQNVKYSLDETTQEIKEEVLGAFTQYPLKLAWAITIHKSQGLTFERAIIDAQAAFAHGQVYVALSRCKSFEGIVLRSRITTSSVKTDSVVKSYTEEAGSKAPDRAGLQLAKRNYQRMLLEELFSFAPIQRCFDQLHRVYREHENTLTTAAALQVHALSQRAETELFVVANRFAPQLVEYCHQETEPEGNAELQSRISKAGTYFTDKIGQGLLPAIKELPTATDNQAVRQAVVSKLEALQRELFMKNACFVACTSGFSTRTYTRGKVKAELDFARSASDEQSKRQDRVPKNLPHPALYKRLSEWRQQLADEQGIRPWEVVTNITLAELVTFLPTNNRNLLSIKGIGKAKLKRFGEAILKIIESYSREENVPVNLGSVAEAPKPPSGNTKLISLEMFEAGKSIDEIARLRTLARTTIEGHLAFHVGEGRLDISRVMTPEKIADITDFFTRNPTATVAEAKTTFGDKYSYGELKMVAWRLRSDST